MPFLLSKEDKLFQTQVESCTIAVGDFNHKAHLRLAYIYLSDHDVNAANTLVNKALHRLLKHNQIEASAKYHETLTQAWLLVVNHFMNLTQQAKSADSLIEQYPQLLDSNILLTHYSSEVLFSKEARAQYIEPDRKPFHNLSTP